MTTIRSIQAFYPAFQLGCLPQAIGCTLAIVEANGRRYLKTPFAMVDAHGEDDAERQIGRGYYATAADCEAYLASEYPWHAAADPIMTAMFDAIHYHGTLVGPAMVADTIGTTVDRLYKMARGHREIGRKAIREAVKALAGKPQAA